MNATPSTLAETTAPHHGVRPGRVASARRWVEARAAREAGEARGGVLIHAPSSAFQAPGGGEAQLVQTARHLERLGVAVRLFSSWTDRIEDYRVLHLFGMSREGLELARIARGRGVPVVLSPICWLEPAALRALAGSRMLGLWHAAKWSLKPWVRRLGGWRDELIRLSAALLPNSTREAAQLVRYFGADPARIAVVPNGVDARFAQADPGLFRSIHGDRPFVLYTGRIEPRKNVLGLIHAARAAGRALVVMGDAPPGREEYHEACKAAGRGVATFHPAIEHDDPRLASAYAAARVFALPSWFETPGLAAIEAALAGAAVVVTPFGSTREYFGDRVQYARPDRPESIARAIDRAWDDGPNPSLRRIILERFLWTHVAQRTAEAYDRVAR